MWKATNFFRHRYVLSLFLSFYQRTTGDKWFGGIGGDRNINSPELNDCGDAPGSLGAVCDSNNVVNGPPVTWLIPDELVTAAAGLVRTTSRLICAIQTIANAIASKQTRVQLIQMELFRRRPDGPTIFRTRRERYRVRDTRLRTPMLFLGITTELSTGNILFLCATLRIGLDDCKRLLVIVTILWWSIRGAERNMALNPLWPFFFAIFVMCL